LLISGILPGLLTAFGYSLMIMIRAKFNPDLAPPPPITYSLREKVVYIREIWPIPLILVGIVISIYGGYATATEAAAVGAAFTFIVAAMWGRLSGKLVWDCVADATQTTGAVFFIVISASLF